MKYMGSKRRIAKEILPIILKNRADEQYYVEPFCGGCNTLDKVTGPRIGGDANKYLIALLLEMQKPDFELPFVGESGYQEIKNNRDNYPAWLVGYVGFQLSFGAKFFGGYRRDKKGVRDYENEAQQNIKAQQPSIQDVEFYWENYFDLEIPENSIIYCDPPYANSTKYSTDFNSDDFWIWAENKSKDGHRVFVSEYSAPPNWECVWQKEVTTGLDVNSSKKDIEKLFTLIQL